MLWVEINVIYIDGESGSLSAVEAGDGARYWRLIEAGVEYGEAIKNPCVGRGLACMILTLIVLYRLSGCRLWNKSTRGIRASARLSFFIRSRGVYWSCWFFWNPLRRFCSRHPTATTATVPSREHSS